MPVGDSSVCTAGGDDRTAVFKALSDPHRLQLLDALSEVRCHCGLQEMLDLAPNLLSYHLRILREAGLIEGVRRGRWVDYRIAVGARSQVAGSLPQVLRP